MENVIKVFTSDNLELEVNAKILNMITVSELIGIVMINTV